MESKKQNKKQSSELLRLVARSHRIFYSESFSASNERERGGGDNNMNKKPPDKIGASIVVLSLSSSSFSVAALPAQAALVAPRLLSSLSLLFLFLSLSLLFLCNLRRYLNRNVSDV